MVNLNEIKEIIETNVLAFATSSKDGKPNVIAVASVKVKDDKIIITDNYMDKSKKNLDENNNIAIVVWKGSKGYQIKGTSEYFTEGENYDFIKNLPENKDMPTKGAIVITVGEIYELK